MTNHLLRRFFPITRTLKPAFLLIGAAFFLNSTQLSGQVFDVPQTGSDTSNSCFGILRDPGGTGFYPGFSNGYFVIDPPGNSAVSLIFSSFFTQQFSDYVRVYDGIGTTGTLIGTYSGNALPSGGSAISSTQGAITVQFVSNCCTNYSGFQLTWTAITGTAPNASFAVNTAPAYNTPVQFFNTTTNGGTYLWEFGDGATSTLANPVHNYTTAGPVQARLIATNCSGSDTTAYTTINVQAAPVGSLSTDTVNLSVACGSSNAAQFTISNSGSGALSYGLQLQQSVANTVFQEDFETSSLGAFVVQNPGIISTSFQSSGAPQGSQYLDISGGGWINDGLKATLSPSTPEYISYRVKGTTSSFHGYTRFRGRDNFNTIRDLFVSYFRFGQLRIDYGLSTGGSTTYFHPGSTANTWYRIELKNIDFAQNSYDIYIDGVAVITNARFINTNMASLEEVILHNSNNTTFSVDDFQISANDLLSKITYNPKSGNLQNGSSNVIFLNADASTLNAGTYWLQFAVTSNDTSLDGRIVYLKLEVTGTAILTQSLNCFNLGTVFTGFGLIDSVQLSNSGCDTLNFTSITTSNTDITVSNNSLQIAPGDSVYLFVTLNPTIPTTYTDTIFLNGPDTNSYVCLNATAVGAPLLALDSTSYKVNYTGCGDTVTFPLTIYNNGLGNLNWGTSSSLTSNITDDFETTAFNTNIWSSWGSGANQNSNCGVISGNRSLSFAGGPRFVNTVGLNTTSGGTISYSLNQGNCEFADGGEGVYLEYSTDGGNFWTQIRYDYTTSTSLIINVNEPIPAGAQGSNVMFRLIQKQYSGSSFDTWIIDDFALTAGVSNTLVFSPDTSVVAPGDSVGLLAKIGIQGLSTGTYNFQAFVRSNDPANPVYSFPVTLNLTGIPNIVVPTACADFDTAMTGSTNVDSIMLINDGCGDLVLSGLSTNTTEFTVLSGLSTIAAGDTAYVSLSFTASATLGTINDTLTITSNDTLAKVCLTAYAIGAPVAEVSPDSIYASFTSCNDSITIPLKLRNPGMSPLSYEVKGSSSVNGVKVVLYRNNRFNFEVQNIKTILGTIPNVNIVESYATTATVLANELVDAQAFIVPEGSSFLPSGIIPTLQNFVSSGGTYIHVLNSFTQINNVGILPNITGSSSVSSSNIINNVTPGHPIMAGVSATLSYLSATREVTFSSGTNYTVLAKRPTSPANSVLVAVSPYGKGHGVYIGYDYFQHDLNADNMLKQAVTWSGGSLPDYISVSPDSGQVATADSVTINVTIRTAGLNNGRDTSEIVIETNDPLNPDVTIPVVIDISGTSESVLLYPSTCLDFDSLLVGATAQDSILVGNIGCDSLSILGSSSSSGDFSLVSLPGKIAPGDSTGIWVSYTPSAIGSVSDTLFIFGDADTLAVCVQGKGLGAPLASVNPDTLEVTINSCKGFNIQNLNIQNNGQGSMNYDISLGSTYEDTSRVNYSVAGALTSHSFGNTPSTTDTIWFTVVVNGDFDQTIEDYSVIVEGTTIASNLTSNVPVGTNDTARFFYTGPNISTWLADNTLDVDIQNTGSVASGFVNAKDFHWVQVRMGGATPPWLTMLSPKTGNLTVGSNVNKSFVFNPAGLTSGTYTTTIRVRSNDPVNPDVLVPVIFNVIDEPEIAISDTCLIYPTTLLGDTSSADFWIYNRGCQSLSISSIISANNGFTISPGTGSIPAGDSLMINVQFIPTAIGAINSNLIINNNDTTVILCLLANANAKPIADFNFSVENACAGEIQFLNNSQYSPTGFYWDFGDGSTSTQPNVTHFFTKPGTYRVFFRAVNNAGFDTISKMITVNPFVGDFYMSDDTVLINTPVNFYDSTIVASKWNWNFGDGNTDTVQNPIHSYAATGVYTVSLIAEDSRNCQLSLTKSIYVVDGIGLNEFILDGLAYSVFPNPGSGRFYLEGAGIDWSEYELSVFDVSGRIVYTSKPMGLDRTELDLRKLAQGTYRLSIGKDGQMKTGTSLIIQ